jgi:hypothetical protein
LDEDWAAVGQAIAVRLDERGMTMTELASQAEVSLTTVRELVHVLSTRRRHPRTLGKISKTLGWPENHLVQVLRGGTSDGPGTDSTEVRTLRAEVQELRERVEALEERL